MNYKERLEDARWKARRREILDRDMHRCLLCGDKDDVIYGHHAVLNVHHLRYEKGREPWEYPDGDLVTLCQRCHQTIHEIGIELEARKSKISSGWICGIRLRDDSNISAGSVLVIDEMDLIFMVADKPFFKAIPFTAPNGISSLPIQDYPISKFVEVTMSYKKGIRKLDFNEYILPIDGILLEKPRPATDDEKQILLQAVNDFMK